MLIEKQVRGIPIRWCAAINVLTLNFLAPFLLGAEQFGLATTLLVIPYIVQAIVEPVVMAVSIKCLVGDRRNTTRIGILSRHTCIFGAFGWLGAYGFTYCVPTLQTAGGASPVVQGAVAVYLAAAIVNTHFSAIAYANNCFRQLATMYLLSGVCQAIALLVLAPLGYLGMLLALCIGQVTVVVGFLRSPTIASSLPLLKFAKGHNFSCWLKEYLPALSPRLTTLLLGSGLLAFASVSLGPIAIAQLKVNLSLINTLRFLLPVSPELIQATFGESGPNAPLKRRSAYLFVAALLFAGACFAVILALVAPWSRSFLFESSVHRVPIDILFVGVPFFVLINPFSSYLYAVNQNSLLVIGCAAAVVAFLLGSTLIFPPIGFVLGSVMYIVTVVAGEILHEHVRRVQPSAHA